MQVIPRLAPLLRYSGADFLLSRTENHKLRHLWSLFALYNVERMVMLDHPWWIYDATDQVESFLSDHARKARVFEFGAGASTVWLAKRAGQVHSVEHDARFAADMGHLVRELDNVVLHHVTPTPGVEGGTATSGEPGYEGQDFADYVSVVSEVGGPFDLIVVDGRARVACLAAAIPQLSEDGLIVFDNAARERYAPGLGDCGLEVEILKGHAPSLPWRETTGLLRRGHPPAP